MKIARLLLALAFLAGSFASATTVIPPTFEQLVERAEFIFEGTVKDVRSQWVGEGAQRHIATYVTFAVVEQVKGNAGASYTLQMVGGTVGDTTMEVTDAPRFAAGDRDIVFVENNGRQFIPLVGIMHGRFRIQRDSGNGREMLADDHGDILRNVHDLGHEEEADAAAPASEAPMTPAQFKSAIRAQLAAK